MKLKEQVTSFELSKKLKELGVKQDSLWWWNNQGLGHGHIGHYNPDISEFSMFTVAELGKILPHNYYSQKDYPNDTEWFGMADSIPDSFPLDEFAEHCKANNEADCRAKMLIYLIENKLMEIPR